MHVVEKLTRPLTEAKYLNADNVDRYRSIMRIFYENYEKLKYWMYQEEVYAEMIQDPYFSEYRMEQCQQDLTALTEWKNLITIQDTRKVASLEEFKNKKYRYQMSEYSVEIERLVIRLENLFIEGASLEPALLEQIRRGIERFPAMASKDINEVSVWWNDLNHDFIRLNQNYQDYIRDLNSVKAEEMMRTKEFLVFKDKLVEYLRSFIKGLQRNVGVIEEHLRLLDEAAVELQKESVIGDLNRIYFENRGFLNDYQLTQTELFAELDEQAWHGAPPARRYDIYARYQGVKLPFGRLLSHLEEEIAQLQELIRAGDRELFEDILANTMSRKIRGKINSSTAWVEKMNVLMGAMDTSSGLRLSLRWRSKTAEHEDQLDTKELVGLLKKDYRLMREEEAARLSLHFRSKVEEARRHAKDSGRMISFYQVMKETLDYRKWFEFQLFYQKSGERQKELTNSAFGTFSGGEKAMAMYVPLFSAVVAKYQGGRADAPRLISLDEAFAGVDNKNIRDMFRLMAEFQFNFIINSQVLWGDCDTLDALAIYQLIRPENAKFVTVMSYLWNGKAKEMLDDEEKLEQRAAELG